MLHPEQYDKELNFDTTTKTRLQPLVTNIYGSIIMLSSNPVSCMTHYTTPRTPTHSQSKYDCTTTLISRMHYTVT
jgi:hypothetical protein